MGYLDQLIVDVDRFDFEINPDSHNEGVSESVFREA